MKILRGTFRRGVVVEILRAAIILLLLNDNVWVAYDSGDLDLCGPALDITTALFF